MVPEVGLEPTRLATGDFESPMYTNFITQAKTYSCISFVK